jgi:hypothetical protein
MPACIDACESRRRERKQNPSTQQTACWFGWLLMVGAGLKEKYCWLVAGGWFVLREK